MVKVITVGVVTVWEGVSRFVATILYSKSFLSPLRFRPPLTPQWADSMFLLKELWRSG